MAAEAEAAREARAKVVAAEGEQKASLHLKEAALVLEESTSALQLRYLQVIDRVGDGVNFMQMELRLDLFVLCLRHLIQMGKRSIECVFNSRLVFISDQVHFEIDTKVYSVSQVNRINASRVVGGN